MPLQKLNPEQFRAATTPLGHNLVIASAGTGKTSTIVARIAYLLHKGVAPKSILLLTFTNKAAAEMVSRIEAVFGKKAKEIEAGTFHAVSYRWLKNIDPQLVLKQPKELKTLFKTVYERRDFQRAQLKPFQSSTLFDLYSLYQNSEFSKNFARWIVEKYPDHEEIAPIYHDIVLEFEELKDAYGFLSFNDLLLKAIAYKEKLPSFQEVLVDEFQDTNNLQGHFLEAIRYESLFCVGDYDQSIYAFNGANINIIASFKERFADARIYNLSKNYRSTKPILELADRVISHNERIYPKKLEVIRKEKGIPPKLLIYNDLYEQYEDIARKIQRSSTPFPQIAVIFRNNVSADGIEAALRQKGISCKRKGSISFFDLKEIKALFDLLSLLINPKDMLAFIHIFEYTKGMGSHSAKDLYEGVTRCGGGDFKRGLLTPQDIKNPFDKKERNYQLALFDDFVQVGSKSRFANLGLSESFMAHPVLTHPRLSQEGALFLYELHELFKKSSHIKKPATMVELLLQCTIFQNIAKQLAQKRAKRKDGTIDEDFAREAMEKIVRRGSLVKELAKQYSDIYRFYNAMVLGGNEMSQGEGVQLLTIHASKGLEFEEVYIVDLMEGRFPNIKLASKGGSIEEERRLFYVAVTRAKRVLYLSFARYDRVKKQEFLPSRFLQEAGLLD